MISFFTGVPGSGKSYYAVNKIYNNFSNDSHAKREEKFTSEVCFTNINELDLSKFHDVHKLDFDILKRHLSLLHKMYRQKSTDDELIEQSREFGLHKAFFVIDECHNFFDTRNEVLVWWLSYHRHLFHEILCITQNLTLVDSKYRSFSEFFYKAAPMSLNLFSSSSFKYFVYCDSRMSNLSKSGVIKVKKNPVVFSLYGSGDKIKSQNIIFKYLFGSFVVFLILILYFKFVISDRYAKPENENNITVDKKVSVSDNKIDSSSVAIPENSSHSVSTIQHNNGFSIPESYQSIKPLTEAYQSPTPNYQNQNSFNNNSQHIQQTKSKIYTNLDQKHFFVFKCSNKDCVVGSVSFPIAVVNHFIKEKVITLIHNEKISDTYIKMYVFSYNDFYEFITMQQQNQSQNLSQGFNNAPVPPQYNSNVNFNSSPFSTN